MIVRAHGGPEAIERERFDPGTPGEGEVLIAQDAVGLNFIDTYYRTGLYPAPLPPVLLPWDGELEAAACCPSRDRFALARGPRLGWTDPRRTKTYEQEPS